MSGFSLDVSQFAEEVDEVNDEIIRATAIALFKSIILGNPVDTGRSRNNWFATGKDRSVRVTEGTDKNGSKAISRMTKKVQSLTNAEIIQLTNNLPYIEELEDGHSDQAPNGMVKINILRLEKILEAEAKKRQI